MRTELIGEKGDQLTLVNYENTYEIFSKEQFSDIPKALSTLEKAGEIVSIKKIYNLAGQIAELEEFLINLKTSVGILDTLIYAAYKLDKSSTEYRDEIEKIASFIFKNIQETSEARTEELYSLLTNIGIK